MALKITKQEYTKLIEQDLAILNQYLPDNLENDHIKLVLCNSIEMHYPSDCNTANSENGKLPIADVSGSLPLIEQYKKICRLAEIPELIIENPYFIEPKQPTDDDIKWAKSVIDKHKGNDR